MQKARQQLMIQYPGSDEAQLQNIMSQNP